MRRGVSQNSPSQGSLELPPHSTRHPSGFQSARSSWTLGCGAGLSFQWRLTAAFMYSTVLICQSCWLAKSNIALYSNLFCGENDVRKRRTVFKIRT